MSITPDITICENGYDLGKECWASHAKTIAIFTELPPSIWSQARKNNVWSRFHHSISFNEKIATAWGVRYVEGPIRPIIEELLSTPFFMVSNYE